jgi:thioredoxin
MKQVDSPNEFKEVLASAGDRLVVVDFFATWCGPCKDVAPIFENYSRTYTNAIFIKVDVDKNKQIAQSEGVSAMPTFKLYLNKSKVAEVVGGDMNQLESLIKKHITTSKPAEPLPTLETAEQYKGIF